MAVDEKWYFTKEQLLQSPSRKSGYDVDKELSCRQQAANFIQDMGQRLQVSQLCINTAIVYMHRFYVFHSLAAFHRNAIAAAALFLAAKVEEQPRKLEHVIKVAHMCLHRENPNLDTKSEIYLEQAQDLVFNENVLLQTLGFDVAIDHPHTHVVRCCQLVRASKDLAQTSYFMASNSLHLTTMCLQYKPTVVACFCIHLACKWSNWEIPRSNEGKDWFWYIDKTVTIDLLEQLTAEFLAILDKCPTKLKRKMMSMNQNNTPGFTQQSVGHDGLQFDEPRKLTGSDAIKPPEGLFPLQKSNSQSSSDKGGASSTAPPSVHAHHQKIDYREYREKKERERMEREKQQQRDGHNTSSSNHHHHSKSNIMPNKSHGQSRSSSGSMSHKSYQQPPHHGMQQNMHFQNMKDGRDSNSQSFQSSTSVKDSNYLKQHPPHTEREGTKDNVTFHGQYSQNSSLQHQGYPHKSESNYGGSYPHRESNRGSHGVQGSGSSNMSQSHHSQNQISAGSSSSLANNQKEYLMGSQRESVSSKDPESQSQSLGKDPMSSSIRDIIGQSVSQKDVHSMTNERKEHMREKSRMNYVHGTSTINYRSDSVKGLGLNVSESSDRKMDDFASKLKEKSLKKAEEEPVIETVKTEPPRIKSEKFDETDVGDENSTWSLSNMKSEKSNVPITMKTDTNSGKNELSIESNKLDSYGSNSDGNKSQSIHSAKMFDSKYKTHHYHSSNKSSEVPQIKIEKPGAQCSSDVHKKISDRGHDKHRKIQELERISHGADGSGNLGDMTKHHKLNKEMSDKNKMLLTGQQGDQRMKEKMSPSLYQKMKSIPRPSGLGYVKSEPGHFTLDANPSNNANPPDKSESSNQLKSVRPVGTDDSSKTASGFQKQKPHDFGNSGGQGNVQDANAIKSSKTFSIFSPDSKIPPQNILSSLEKDSKKNNMSGHRSHSSNKTPPNSTSTSKRSTPTPVLGAITTSTSSTTGSLFSPPLPKNVPSIPPRHRTPSSGSEPELIPVLTKLEETPGYENIIRERKIALSHANEVSPGGEKEKKMTIPSEKNESSSAFLFGSEHKVNAKDSKTSEVKTNLVKSDVITQSIASKSVSNVKFPNEIRSDLGAVIYSTNPKSLPVTKSSQGFSSDSVSTVNLLGIEKMVDTSISPAKSTSQFPTASLKSNSAHFNASNASMNLFGSSSGTSSIDQTDKIMCDQVPSKTSLVSNQEMTTVDVLGYSEKKRSEKKKKKEKHKHKEKDKDKSERKKEKKKHKAKDKERSKEREKSKDKEKYRDKDKHKEKEIDVVSSETPIKITIPKDKISGSLKFKISKDCLKKEDPDSLKSNTSGELKIKISKDVINSIGGYREESKSDSKKRDRSPKSSSDLPHPKSMKPSEKKSSGSSLKSNGTEGPSRNSSSHRYSVSENGSCFDISSLYDFPFDFEENGHGIIKTPDYDFDALDATEFPQELNTSPENKEPKECYENSHNESETTRDECVATSEPEADAVSKPHDESCDVDVSCGDITTDDSIILKPISPILEVDFTKRSRTESVQGDVTSSKSSPLDKTHSLGKRDGQEPTEPTNSVEVIKSDDQRVSLENCDVLKNYKTILDNHSKRCETDALKRSVSPAGSEDTGTEPVGINNNKNDDNNNKNTCTVTEPVPGRVNAPVNKINKTTTETENPNYYNKYFKKDGGSRIRTRDEKRTVKGRLDESGRFDDKLRYYDGRWYRGDYNERERREDRRFYNFREFNKDSSQYYFERKDERRYEYPGFATNQYFNAQKPEGNLGNLNYDMTNTGTPTVYQTCPLPTKAPPQFPQLCDPSVSANPDMNVQYQYGYFNNYLYPNGGYRFYGNVPYMNVSLIQQQQPMPPGTGDSFVPTVQPPPLPLEPPPDLPPPPETPPPPPK